MSNLPDDWGAYYRTCTDCGYRAHASDGYDCKCVETFQCGRHYHLTVGSPGEREKLHRCDEVVTDEDKLTEVSNGEAWCNHCVFSGAFTCAVCDEVVPDEDRSETLGDEDYVCIGCEPGGES